MPLKYRLALDLGTNSIGWCMLRLDMEAAPSPAPNAVIRAGVRVFGDGRDPMSGASLAVARRDARALRRNRDRKLDRKRRVMDALVSSGLFPTDSVERREVQRLDPYECRSRGLTELLSPYEFGRALFHLNQRRGFQSNRKTDGDDADGSLMKGAISSLREQLAADGFRTVGQWLAVRHGERKSVRSRLRGTTVKDRHYDLYFDRAMIRQEYDALWEVQQGLDPEMFTAAKRDAVAAVMFYQRDLRPVRPGRCTFEPDRDRAARALPTSQRIRIYQEVNNLGIETTDFGYTPLTRTQRDLVVGKLEHQKTLSFDAMRRALKLAGSPRFNLESAKRKDLKGNSTSFVLAADDRFGSQWHELAWEVQDVIVQRILDEEDEETLVAWLGEQHGLTQEQALRVSAARSAISRLAPGYARLSSRATARILPHLVEDAVTFNVAVDRAGYGSHSALTHAERTGEVLAELPYYGEYLQRHVGHGTGLVTDLPADRYGRIANPTVHIALNEVRKVVNSLIGEYGPPTQVIVEVVRDLKLSKDRKDELTKEQALRQKENEGYARQIKELLGIDASRADIQKMRLWVELDRAHPMDRRCPYTGEHISMERLFSPAVEVEHILPFRRTLDDSMNNKTVSMVKANRYKGDRTPYEAFGHSPQPYDYPQMLDRVRAMPKGKAYRFAPDGYERWLREDADFLARALNDTAYLSRIAKEYLELVTPGEVWVVPGRLTGALRHHWGLNSLLHDSGEKNRADHRHHAIDAVVVGLMGRASLQTFANASGRGVTVDRQLTSSPRPEPLVGLRERVRDVVGSIVVSHRPNHGHQRQMNNDTNYGLRGAGYVALRRRLDGYDSVAAVEKAQFADPVLKVRLLKHLGAAEGEQFKDRLATFTQDTGTRRVRVLEKLDTIAIAGNPSAAYRAPTGVKARPDNAVRGVKGDSNYCIEIFVGDKGVWAGEVISTFEAYRIVQEQGADRLRDPALTQSGRPLVMRLMRDDVVRMDIDGQRGLYRLCSFRSSGAMFFAGLNEANVDARVRAKEIAYLQKSPGPLGRANARLVTITPSGRIHVARPPR